MAGGRARLAQAACRMRLGVRSGTHQGTSTLLGHPKMA